MSLAPKISVLLAVYNAEKYVGEAIDSLLNQTFSDFEVIVVNDGSTDKSLEILNQFSDPRLKVISQRNHGLASSLNTAANHATGEYLARMDADDICLPQRFEAQVNFLDRNQDVSVVGSAVEYIDSNGNYLARSFPPLASHIIAQKIMGGGCCLAHPSVMIRTQKFKQVGGYDERMCYTMQDLLLWAKMIATGHVLQNLPMPLIQYRLSESAIGNIQVDEEYIRLKAAIFKDSLGLTDQLAAQFGAKYLELKKVRKKSSLGRKNDVLTCNSFRLYRILLLLGASPVVSEHFVYLLRDKFGN